MALIGNGAQSEFQALAFRESCLSDTDPAASAKLAAHPVGHGSLQVRVCNSTIEAVRGVDTVTARGRPICTALCCATIRSLRCRSLMRRLAPRGDAGLSPQ